jgi:hypothetical protein
VFLAQGSADPVIPASITHRFAEGLCRAGTILRYDALPGVDHYTVAMRSAGTAASWIADRFAGKPAPDDCPRLRQGPRMAAGATPPHVRRDTPQSGSAALTPQRIVDRRGTGDFAWH